jgi:hypothetical protein
VAQYDNLNGQVKDTKMSIVAWSHGDIAVSLWEMSAMFPRQVEFGLSWRVWDRPAPHLHHTFFDGFRPADTVDPFVLCVRVTRPECEPAPVLKKGRHDGLGGGLVFESVNTDIPIGIDA